MTTRTATLLLLATVAAMAVVLAGAAGAEAGAAKVRADTFANLAANGNSEGLVLFYRSSVAGHEEALETLQEVAEELGDTFRPGSFSIKTCDGDLPENKAEYDGAGFDTRVFWFTTTPRSGIEKYEGPTDTESIVFHVRSKFADFDPSDVQQFRSTEELYDMMDEDVDGRPLFVKCYEQWCTHCKALAPTFSRAATYFQDQVQFVEVECSKDDDTREFCTSNDVTGYPVLLLITPDRKVRYDSGNRNFIAFDNFFREQLDDYLSPRDAEESAAAKGKKKKGKKKKGKKGKKKKKKKSKKSKKKKKKAAAAAAAAAAADDEAPSSRVSELEGEVSALKETVATLEAARREDQKAIRALTRKVDALVKSLAEGDDEEDDE